MKMFAGGGPFDIWLAMKLALRVVGALPWDSSMSPARSSDLPAAAGPGTSDVTS